METNIFTTFVGDSIFENLKEKKEKKRRGMVGEMVNTSRF